MIRSQAFPDLVEIFSVVLRIVGNSFFATLCQPFPMDDDSPAITCWLSSRRWLPARTPELRRLAAEPSRAVEAVQQLKPARQP